jgi:type I restriction enzyme R subunit
MATGSGKTFTAITFVYRLLKYTNARRILFLVDTHNLGDQAEKDVQKYCS